MISKAPSRPFSLQVLQACKALSNVYLQSSAHRALGSQSPTTRFFLLSGTPAGRTVSRLSGGVIGGRCIGLNEKAK
jgi:hypothetical protein